MLDLRVWVAAITDVGLPWTVRGGVWVLRLAEPCRIRPSCEQGLLLILILYATFPYQFKCRDLFCRRNNPRPWISSGLQPYLSAPSMIDNTRYPHWGCWASHLVQMSLVLCGTFWLPDIYLYRLVALGIVMYHTPFQHHPYPSPKSLDSWKIQPDKSLSVSCPFVV